MSPFLPATPAYDGIGCTSTQLRPREQQTLQVKKDGRVARTAHPKPEQLTWKRYRIPLHPRATQRKSARIMFLICYHCVCKKQVCVLHTTQHLTLLFLSVGAFWLTGEAENRHPPKNGRGSAAKATIVFYIPNKMDIYCRTKKRHKCTIQVKPEASNVCSIDYILKNGRHQFHDTLVAPCMQRKCTWKHAI